MTVFVETAKDLDQMLEQLRRLGTDHQWVEVKKAAGGFPMDLWKSVSALANTGGGLVLLGIDENSGFEIVGLADPGGTATTLQHLCEQAVPALRARITVIDHASGPVVAARIPAVDRAHQPCHFPTKGNIGETSFCRVHDGDIRFTASEIAHLVDAHNTPDHSRRPAPEGSLLEPTRVQSFEKTLEESERGDALVRYGAMADGHPTLAGWLSLGDHPEGLSPMARVSCIAAPRDSDPVGSEQRGIHIEGVVGELLDDVLRWISRSLGPVQVRRDATLVDELDYPAGSLRELVSNALVHRSFRSADEATTISVVVSDLIVITNSGGVHPGVEPGLLGLSPLSTPRNYTLVRLCEKITTPEGTRIVESMASGIPRADRLCREAGCLPPLFIVGPALFTAVCVRGRLDLVGAAQAWPAVGTNTDKLRILAAIIRLSELTNADPNSILHNVRIDTALAARIIGTTVMEHAAVILNALQIDGALIEKPGFQQPHWELNTEARALIEPGMTDTTTVIYAGKKKRPQHETIGLLLRQLADEPSGELARSDFKLGIAQRALANVLNAALDRNLIESTSPNLHDPRRKYRLTQNGRRQLARVH